MSRLSATLGSLSPILRVAKKRQAELGMTDPQLRFHSGVSTRQLEQLEEELVLSDTSLRTLHNLLAPLGLTLAVLEVPARAEIQGEQLGKYLTSQHGHLE